MPMSQAEAGKLGTIKARSIISAKKKQRIEEYEKDPILCLTCQTAITYENKIKKNKFCNHKCAAEFTMNSDGAVNGIDDDSIMGQNLTKVKTRHYHGFVAMTKRIIKTKYGLEYDYEAVDK